MDGGSGLPPREADDDDNTRDPVFLVFHNGVLRGLILEKVINVSGSSFPKKPICDLRLVSKGFLDSISHLLKKLGATMKVFYFGDHNPVVEAKKSDGKNNQLKRLETMIDLFSSPDRLALSSVLPFTLFLDGNCKCLKRAKALDVLSKFFTSEVCSTSLAEFDILFPEVMDIFVKLAEGNRDKLSFPNLLKFDAEGHVTGGIDSEKLAFVQLILNAAENLKKFILRLRASVIPPDAMPNVLKLPTTLEQLFLRATLTGVQLQELLLVRNPLSNLSYLSIDAPGSFDEEDLRIIEKILGKFQETLEFLMICQPDEEQTRGDGGSQKVIRVPEMKKLDFLMIGGTGLSWTWKPAEEGMSLARCFPVLKSLQLEPRNDTAFLQFLEEENFESVVSFKTSRTVNQPPSYFGPMMNMNMSDEEDEWEDDDEDDEEELYKDNLTVTQIRSIRRGFPNLQSLEAPIELLGFKVLFAEMRQLKMLKVHVEVNDMWNSNPIMWKQILLGITMEEVERVKKMPKERKYGDVPVQLRRVEGQVSILDLSELTHFKLGCDLTRSLTQYRLLTHMVFYLGFMQMGNLKKLEFNGGFKPTDEMIQKWNEGDGRTITYVECDGEEGDGDSDDGSA